MATGLPPPVPILYSKGERRGIADLAFEICNQHQNVCVAGTIKILLHKTPVS